jgi:TrmH family RNA methyltransferase
VGTRSAGNLGAVCRIAKAFGFDDVRLVRSDLDPGDPEGIRLAHGAEDLLQRISRASSLDSALKDCVRAIATTARPRDWSRRILSPDELAVEYASLEKSASPLAVVFGPEDRGLTNEELARCDAIVSIAKREHSRATLSLPASAAIIAHALAGAEQAHIAHPAARGLRSQRNARPLLSSEIDDLLEEICAAWSEIGFRPRPNELRFRGSLRDFLSRARPTAGDRLFLRHMFAQIGKWKRRTQESKARAVRGSKE